MSVHRSLEKLNGIEYGNIDLGVGPEIGTTASEAWVHMITSLEDNDNFKIAVSYVFIHSLSAEQRAEMVLETIRRCYESGCVVVALTCDGPAVNKKMLKQLGANYETEQKQPFFNHPCDKDIKIVCFLDPPHGLKLVRNHFSRHKLYSQKGVIDFSYIVKLFQIQQKCGFNMGNKLSINHIDFKNVSMKVVFAAQTLSNSVADSLEFLQELGKFLKQT